MKIIVMAGGVGTRLWPLSRTHYPKQFLKLNGMERSIFQLTIERCLKLTGMNEIYIVTNENYKHLISSQIEELGYEVHGDLIFLEPHSKNTLPAIYYCIKAIREQGDDVVAVFASDHLIGDVDRFVEIIGCGLPLTDRYLLTFGVCPDIPETGFGYIKPGRIEAPGFVVDEFKEKPDYETAQRYLQNGYLWNSGMFMFRTDIFVEEVKKHSPAVYKAFEQGNIVDCFAAVPNISIDFGIMEKSERVAVIPMPIQWSDLGNFATLYDKYEIQKDEQGNVLFNNEVILDSHDNMIYAQGEKTIVLIGVGDLVVVDQNDALLICHKEHTQKVKDAVQILKERKDMRADYHLT
ncbi:MAG: mannose-1-phosphate guanylyltransferase [Syntrophomonas sp.]|nr:mannose-1-phosphate guanylyltransferase [Syntrophomonas sp.]